MINTNRAIRCDNCQYRVKQSSSRLALATYRNKVLLMTLISFTSAKLFLVYFMCTHSPVYKFFVCFVKYINCLFISFDILHELIEFHFKSSYKY